METKRSVREMGKIREKSGYESGHFVDATGRAGGLGLLWSEGIKVDVKSYSSHHVDVVINGLFGADDWRLTYFYGWSDSTEKHISWELMRELSDIGYVGEPFTWWNKQPEPNEIVERLDRGVANMAWMEMFPHLTVHHLPLDKSDHRSIKIASMTTFNSRRRKVKRFRFEDFWLSSPKSEDIVRGAWGKLHGEGAEGDVPWKIKRVSAALIRWNREEFGNLNTKIKEARERLAVITPKAEGCHIDKVAELIGSDTHEWKEDMVRGLFLEFEADMICNIPLSSMDTNDYLVWHYSKNEAYWVKTGYHFIKSYKSILQGEPSTSKANKMWNKIWNVRIPPKVKTFVWRLCNNAIPTAKGLHTRIEVIDPWCGRRRVEEEEDEYVVRGDEVGNLFAISWAIWNQRNIVVHGGTECCPEEVVARADHIMEAFENTWRDGCEHGGVGHGEGRKENAVAERLEVAWTAPTEGVFMVNVDGLPLGNME
ncbi:hypothetical protein RDABS01_022953 [Bienertia sinuspersici]